MIRLGLGERQKQQLVAGYVERNGIKKVFCFYFKRFPLRLAPGCEVEHVEYSDIIMYKFFYRLLEEIGPDSLVVINECMRTQNRSELTYNCAHHYLGQTPHRIIFEHFPIIEDKQDFMILLDFENKGKFKGKSFDYVYLQQEDIQAVPRKVKMNIVPVETTDADRTRYEKRKETLFANLGDKDPDTIPRALQLLTGDIKKRALEPKKVYVARNKRMKMDNVLSYQEIAGRGKYAIIDTHFRRLDFNDFLKVTGVGRFDYLSTTLPIDTYITTEFAKWKARVDAIYAQAGLYRPDST